MTQTAPWGNKRADDPVVPRRGGNRADDPNCRELTLEYPVSGATCRGPAPADPGYSDCSLPGSSSHGVFQARILEWVAIVFSK